MEWKYIKPLLSIELIYEFENSTKYLFPDTFKQFIIKHNGGRPNKSIFDTNKTKERELKSFLSFNREDKETVWKIIEWNKEELADKYVPFGIDNYGNTICFDKENDMVIFVNHEDKSIEIIADGFDNFINKLYTK